jgi:hypothetical protein
VIHLVISDQHAHPDYSNERADYLSRLILDLHPDVVINIGDAADMPSLSSYDKGKRAFNGRTYAADIAAHGEFQDRLWGPVFKRKKRLPRRVFLIGNHEQRIEKALDLSPELLGTIGLDDLDLPRWYPEVVPYEGSTPGVIEIDGILYAHYFISGVNGKPIGGINPAASLNNKQHVSCTSGHLHLADYAISTSGNGRKLQSLFVGCYQDYDAPWAGASNNLWWRGVVWKTDVSDGTYDPHFASLKSLKESYY